MPGYIPQELLDDILNKVDIVEIVSGYIPLKRAGRNFRALCPFHQEKTPSFMVSPDRQIYHCFGCFPAGSLIKSEKGFHRIEDVQVGQSVLTHRGRFMPVIRTLWRPYHGELIEIYTRKSNLPVTVTVDHEIFAIKIKNCKYKSKESRICQWRCRLSCPEKFFKKYKIQQLPAHQLTLNDYLLYPINREINDIKFIDLNKYYNRKISNFGPDIKSIPTKIEIDERFLKLIGYWIAEGSNHRAYIRFSLGNHERQFANEIKELIEDIFHIKTSIHIRKKGNKTGIEISACNSKLSNIFENLCGKSAENKHIPFELQDLPLLSQRIILDAIFKGDGHMGEVSKSARHRKFKTITTISLVLAEQLKDILLRLGISPTFSAKSAKIDKNNVRHRAAYTISWQENIKWHFSDIMKINNILYQIVPIRKIIKRNFIGDVYNLTVAEDHSYATPNFVVGNCGSGGNAFNFLMKYERLEFPEAVEILAKKAGVRLPEKQDYKTTNINQQIYKIMDLAAGFYQNNLNSALGAPAKNYLIKRNIKEETIKLFRLGFAADKWDALFNYLRAKNISISLLEKAGLVITKEGGGYYDRFRSRVIFPILDIKSRGIGLGGRILPASAGSENDNLAKYINSPETPIYIKGRNLYGLNNAKDAIRESDFVVIVEGYLDCIIPYQEGLHNIVASLGTALTYEQVRLIRRYTHNMVMVYDADAAGEVATLRSLDIFVEEGVSVKVVGLPSGFDPDLFVRKNGIESFKKLIQASKNLFDYKLNVLKSRYNPKEIQSRTLIAQEMLITINKINNAILKSDYIKKLSEDLGVKEEDLISELKKIKDYKPVRVDFEGIPAKPVNINPTEKLLIKLMVEEANILNRLKDYLEPADFQDERAAKIVSIMFDLFSQGKNISPSNLINYLEPYQDLSGIISELTLLPEPLGGDRDKVVDDCVNRLKSKRLKMKKEHLHREIKNAQNLKDEELLKQLMHDFHRLTKDAQKLSLSKNKEKSIEVR